MSVDASHVNYAFDVLWGIVSAHIDAYALHTIWTTNAQDRFHWELHLRDIYFGNDWLHAFAPMLTNLMTSVRWHPMPYSSGARMCAATVSPESNAAKLIKIFNPDKSVRRTCAYAFISPIGLALLVFAHDRRTNFVVFIHLIHSFRHLRRARTHNRMLFIEACTICHSLVNIQMHHLLGIQLKTFQIGSDGIPRFVICSVCLQMWCLAMAACIEKPSRREYSSQVPNMLSRPACVLCRDTANKKYEYVLFFSHESDRFAFE